MFLQTPCHPYGNLCGEIRYYATGVESKRLMSANVASRGKAE